MLAIAEGSSCHFKASEHNPEKPIRYELGRAECFIASSKIWWELKISFVTSCGQVRAAVLADSFLSYKKPVL